MSNFVNLCNQLEADFKDKGLVINKQSLIQEKCGMVLNFLPDDSDTYVFELEDGCGFAVACCGVNVNPSHSIMKAIRSEYSVGIDLVVSNTKPSLSLNVQDRGVVGDICFFESDGGTICLILGFRD